MGRANATHNEVNEISEINVGDVVDCVVEQIVNFGAFVRLLNNQKALIHISEISHNFVKDVHKVLAVNQKVKAKVIKIDNNGRLVLSMKQLENFSQNNSQNNNYYNRPRQTLSREETENFEKKVASFLRTSEAKITDLNTRNSIRNGSKNKRNHKLKD